MPNEVDLHHQVALVLLEKIEADPYPSSTMMDMVEGILGPEEIQAYADILIDKVRDTQFPSYDLLRRISALA
ncbi:MAG TPA: hypothetical protein VNS55_10130 [Nocardioides sp.]|nr:hypothetical protein [Nocardioides sp.]